MDIKQLVLHNVGIYRGRHCFDFETPKEKPVILIGALNGSGKTTIIESLKLALYGESAELGRRGRRGYQDYLRTMINRDAPREEGASVELQLNTDEHGEIRVIRTWKFGKAIKETLEVVGDRVSASLSKDWPEEAERLLPQRLCDLFFFDGEQIEALADPDQTSDVLRTAISSLLGVDLIDSALTDLRVVERRTSSALGESPDVAEYRAAQAELEDLEARSQHLGYELGCVRTRKGVEEAHLRDIERRFDAAGGGYFNRARELEAERVRTVAEIERSNSELRQLASGVLPLALLLPQLKKMLKGASNAQEGREAAIIGDYLADLKEKIEALQKADRERNLTGIEELLRAEMAHFEALAPSAGEVALSAEAIQILQSVPHRIQESIEGAKRLLDQRSGLNEKLDSVDRALAAVPDEASIADLLSKRGRAQERVDSLSREITEAVAQLEVVDKQRVDAQFKIDRCAKRLAESELVEAKVAARLSSVQRSKETLQELRSRVLRKHVAAIRLQTLECYRALLRKEALIDDIEIDVDAFKLRLWTTDSEEIPAERLSAGERQLLATAILWALAKLSGLRLPVFIDTPLGRLDSEHRMNLVLEYFPSASHQVVLLSTDEEIRGEYYEALRPSIGREYTIEYDPQRRSSVVSEGYLTEEAA